MLEVGDEENQVNKKSMYENFADKVEWFLCDYFACFRVVVFFNYCNCYKNKNNNNNKNKSVAISQSASDIILHQSDANIHPLHE